MNPFFKDLNKRFYDLLNQSKSASLKEIATLKWAISENFIEEDSLFALLAQKLELLNKTEQISQIWFELIRKSPLKYTFSTYFIDRVSENQYLKDLINKATQCLYTQIPPRGFLLKMFKIGINPRGALGVFNNHIMGWVITPSGKTPRIEIWYGEKIPVELYKHYSIENFDLLSIKIKLPEELTFASVRVIEKNVGDYPGSPLFIDSPERVKFSINDSSDTESVTVILPVYENREGTIACLESLFDSRNSCKTPFEILVIYDGGTDKLLYEKLLKLHQEGKINLLTLDINRGFISAVNEGFISAKHGDFVILTSDTLVCDDWLDRLRDAAYSNSKIGIVCPITNRGEFFSYPKKSDDEFNPLLLSKIDQVCKNTFGNKDLTDIPIAIGFCAYIKRELLKKIGGLDGKILFRGYGEDVEFSFRAKKAGYKIALSPNVFVYHKGNQSFTEIQKILLAHQNNSAIEELYPKYRENYLKYLSTDPIKKIRERISLNLISPLNHLFVLNHSDRLDPFFELLNEFAKEKSLNLGFIIISEDGNATATFRYDNNLQIEPIDFELPKQIKTLNQIIEKADVDSLIIYGYYEFLLELMKKLKIKKQLLFGHLTPDFLNLLESERVDEMFKNFSEVYVFSERMFKYLSSVSKKTKYFPLINQKNQKELMKPERALPKSSNDDFSLIVTTPFDFEHFKEFAFFAEENRNINFFVNRLELWEGVNLKENVFPLFNEILEDKTTSNILNLRGFLLWHDDPEEELILSKFTKERSLKLYKHEVQRRQYPW